MTDKQEMKLLLLATSQLVAICVGMLLRLFRSIFTDFVVSNVLISLSSTLIYIILFSKNILGAALNPPLADSWFMCLTLKLNKLFQLLMQGKGR